jgi:hypothetical protein
MLYFRFQIVVEMMDSESSRDKLEKRGFAYGCLGCKKYVGERRYVKAHYFKYHTALDKVPFYCSVCHFMGKTERELSRHAKGYKPHKVAEENLKKQGKEAEPLSTYIHKNTDPLQIGDAHIQKLSWGRVGRYGKRGPMERLSDRWM